MSEIAAPMSEIVAEKNLRPSEFSKIMIFQEFNVRSCHLRDL
jgi:hypothetical protein